MHVKAIGPRLREAREGLGKSVREAALALGVSHACLSKWEREVDPIPLERLYTWSRLVGFDTEQAYELWREDRATRDHDILVRAEVRLASRRGAR